MSWVRVPPGPPSISAVKDFLRSLFAILTLMSKSTSEITIDAPSEKVWRILTDPELVKQWQYGSDLTTDWQVGNDKRFHTKWEDTIFEQWGKILVVVPNKIIKYTLFAPRPGLQDKPENYFVMTYELQENQKQTRLIVTQEDNRPQAEDQETQSSGNETSVLDDLKALAEI